MSERIFGEGVPALLREEAKKEEKTSDPEAIKIEGQELIVGSSFTLTFGGQRIVGTIESFEESESGIMLKIKDMTEPEAYMNQVGAFTYSQIHKKWSTAPYFDHEK